jgi:hypothetical protein
MHMTHQTNAAEAAAVAHAAGVPQAAAMEQITALSVAGAEIRQHILCGQLRRCLMDLNLKVHFSIARPKQ